MKKIELMKTIILIIKTIILIIKLKVMMLQIITMNIKKKIGNDKIEIPLSRKDDERTVTTQWDSLKYLRIIILNQIKSNERKGSKMKGEEKEWN